MAFKTMFSGGWGLGLFVVSFVATPLIALGINEAAKDNPEGFDDPLTEEYYGYQVRQFKHGASLKFYDVDKGITAEGSGEVVSDVISAGADTGSRFVISAGKDLGGKASESITEKFGEEVNIFAADTTEEAALRSRKVFDRTVVAGGEVLEEASEFIRVFVNGRETRDGDCNPDSSDYPHCL